MPPLTLLLLFFLISGFILVVFSVPLIFRRVGPNRWYGVRVAQTLEDPKVWYPVNAHAGRWHLAAGVLIMAVALGVYFVPHIDVLVYASTVGVVTFVAIGVGVIQSFRYLRNFVKEQSSAPQ